MANHQQQMKNRQHPGWLVCAILVCSLCLTIGCKSSEENSQDTGTPSEQVNIYLEIVTDAQNMETRHQDLPKKVEHFLERKAIPQNIEERDEFMQVAIIGAGAYWWGGDEANAGKMAVRAYGYSSTQSARFLPDWDADRLLRTKTYATVQKFARMKDFVLSCANRGATEFAKGNEHFIAKGLFAEAVLFYQNALKSGLENAQSRRKCRLSLAACLFKSGNTTEAEKVVLEAWLLDPALELEFGDESTHEFLKSLGEKYHKQFVK